MNASNNKRGVYTLKIDNKDINLLFSMNFWRILSQEGIEPDKLGGELDGSKGGVIQQLEALSKMVLAAGKSYAIKHKTEFDYELDHVFDWLEDIDNKTMNEMFKVMTDTKMFGETVNQGLNRKSKGKQEPSQK